MRGKRGGEGANGGREKEGGEEKGLNEAPLSGKTASATFSQTSHTVCMGLNQQRRRTLCHIMCGERRKEASVFASPVGGEEAKLRNGQLCIFHCSGSLGRTGIRRREVGRWGDSEDGAGRKKPARSRIERGRRRGERGGSIFKNPLKGKKRASSAVFICIGVLVVLGYLSQ